MTKEEIISGLKFTVEMFLFDPSTGEKYTEPRNDMDKTTIDACKGAIELLKQEPKPGYWEKQTDGYSYWYRCSCCGERIAKDSWGNDYFSSYCPECGAFMEGGESDG